MLCITDKVLKNNSWRYRSVNLWTTNQVLQYIQYRSYTRFGVRYVPCGGMNLGLQWSYIKKHIIGVLKTRGYGMAEVKEYIDYIYDKMSLCCNDPFPLQIIFNRNWVKAYINSKQQEDDDNFIRY